MSYNKKVDAAKKFGGAAPFGDESALIKGQHAVYPASYPKYSTGNDVSDSLDTGLKLFLPGQELLRQFPQDKDILLPLVNNKYIQLIATSVQEVFSERVDTKMTVNGTYVTYYHGISPVQVSIQGTVLNDFQDDWRNNLLRAYTRYLRGSRLARLGKTVVVSYMDILFAGEIISLNTGLDSQNQTSGAFNMNFLVQSMRIRRSPLISDYVTKRKNVVEENPNGPTANVTRKNTAVVRSKKQKDIISRTQISAANTQKQISNLNVQRTQLNASLIVARTQLAIAENLEANLPRDATLSQIQQVENEKRIAQNDISVINKSISDVELQKKQLREGVTQRTNTQKPRTTIKQTLPGNVIQVARSGRPQVNRGIPQEVS